MDDMGSDRGIAGLYWEPKPKGKFDPQPPSTKTITPPVVRVDGYCSCARGHCEIVAALIEAAAPPCSAIRGSIRATKRLRKAISILDDVMPPPTPDTKP